MIPLSPIIDTVRAAHDRCEIAPKYVRGGYRPHFPLPALRVKQKDPIEDALNAIYEALGLNTPGLSGWEAWYDAAARGEWR